MIYTLKIICAFLAVSFLILTLIFDIWVYKTTKDFDFVLSFSMSKYQIKNDRLSVMQFLLLKIINCLKIILLVIGFFTVISILIYTF